MALTNSVSGYGTLTKSLHWMIVLLFAAQYFGGHIMTYIGFNSSFAGITTNSYYDWHKSLGLVALLVAIVRIVNRQIGTLPPWASALTTQERKRVHRAEQLFYLAMFVMPISGWLYVMWGNYGVNLFSIWEMPRPLPKDNTLRDVAKWVHIISSWILLATIVFHVGLVMKHQLIKKNGLLRRML